MSQTLTNLREFPNGGFLYYEPSLNWRVPTSLALIGLNEVVMALQIVREQNPASGLDSSFKACLEAVKLFTCARLNFDSRWCGEVDPETILSLQSSAVPSRRSRGCATCGRRR